MQTPQFVISYSGGNRPPSEEEGKENMAKYRAWLAGLGEAAVSPENPLKNTQTVNPDGSVEQSGKTSMSGYTIVSADAIAMEKDCPFLEIGGSLEMSELMQIPG